MGYKFVDADIVIQETEGKLLKDIIASEGVDGFIAVEDRINSSIDCHKSIIATGGSAVYGENAMAHFKEIGTLVYLKLDYDKIKRRLGNIKNRGVVMPEGYTLKKLYDERVKLYERYADITIDCNGLNVEESINKLCEIL